MLRPPAGGQGCPSCGSDNAKDAQFCTQCQAALVEGVTPATTPDVSALAGAAVAGVAVSAAAGYVADAGAVDFDESMDDEVPVEAGPAAPPPLPSEEAAEDFAPPPPPAAFELDEAEAATGAPEGPPPPPDAFELDLDEETGPGAPPPPPPAPSEETGAEADELGDWSLDYDDT